MMKRENLPISEVFEAIEQYRSEIQDEMRSRPWDQHLHTKLATVGNVESRLRLLSRGGIRIIQGGRQEGMKE